MAHLVNTTAGKTFQAFYWRDAKGREVDSGLARGKRVVAIEVKSGREEGVRSGLEAFGAEFRSVRTLVVGCEGIPAIDFLRTPVDH